MRPRFAPRIAAILAALLTACTLEPGYHRPASPVPAPVGGAPNGTAASDIGWHEFFPDPQLQQLIALALDNNRDLRVATLNVATAQARYRIQRADLFPTIQAAGTEQAERFPPGVFGISTGVRAATARAPYNADRWDWRQCPALASPWESALPATSWTLALAAYAASTTRSAAAVLQSPAKRSAARSSRS